MLLGLSRRLVILLTAILMAVMLSAGTAMAQEVTKKCQKALDKDNEKQIAKKCYYRPL